MACPETTITHSQGAQFARQFAGFRIEDADKQRVPLHSHSSADPAQRRATASGLDFDTAVQVHNALAVLVIAEGLDRQGKQALVTAARQLLRTVSAPWLTRARWSRPAMCTHHSCRPASPLPSSVRPSPLTFC